MNLLGTLASGPPGASRVRGWQAYSFAILATLATLGLRIALDSSLSGEPTLVLFTVPIMLTAYMGGWRAGLLATGFSGLGSAYWVLAPLHSFQIASAAERWDLSFVVLAGIVISAFNGALHHARCRADLSTREHQQTEERLRESEQFLQSTLDALSSHIAILDQHGAILGVNEPWRRFAGENNLASQHRGVGDNYLQICDSASRNCCGDAAAVANGIRAVMVGQSDEFQLEYACHSPREKRWFLLRVTRFGSGSSTRVVVAHENITARTMAEQALRASELRLRAIFDSEPECVKIVSADGRLLDMNPAGLRVIEADELAPLIGQPVDALVHPEDRAAYAELHRRVVSGETGQLQFRLIAQKGARRWMETHSVPLRDADGCIQSVLSVTRDITLRRQAEDSLRASEANMAAAQRIAHFASWELDLCDSKDVDANPLRWSDEMFRIAGYAPGAVEVSNALFFQLVPAAEHEAIQQAVATAIRERGQYSIVHRLIRPDGEERIVQERALISCDEKTGRPVKIIGTAHDITEQRRAEESLVVQAHMLNSIGQAVIATDRAGLITYVNRFAERLYGWASAEVLGRNILDVTVTNATSEQAAQIVAQLARGEPWSGEFLVRNRDGQEFLAAVTNTPLRDQQSRLVGIVGVSEDITSRKRAEEELSQSRSTLRSILDHIPQRVFWKDRDLIYRGCNRAFAQVLGFNDPSEVIGRNDFDGSWKSVAEQYRADDRSVMDLDAPKFSFEEPGTAADGSPRWFRTSKIPLHDQQGRVTAVLGISEDVTEHKLAKLEIERLNAGLEQRVAQRTEQLFAATQAAERANCAKSEFLSRMSHELRTPMNAILGFAQVLEIEEDLTADQRDSIQQILRGGSHLLKLINEVLDISSIEAGRMTLSPEAVALQEVLEESVRLLHPLTSECKVRLAVLPGEALGLCVLADRQRFAQILLNLLSNAIKYNRSGGSVTVRCVETRNDQGATAIRLSITDTGVGLSSEKVARLFNPFDRLGAEQTRVQGTGLGLMLTRRMVEHMGGTLGVESVAGEGSTFWVELPVAEPLEEPAEPATNTNAAAIDPKPPAHRRALLYIEDNSSNLRLVARILARRPAIELLCAGTGALGLEMAREHRPALILLDLHLPDGTGDKVLAQLRADARTATIPVIMLSADAMPERRGQMMTAGACEFLTKPLEVRAFLALLDQLVDFQGVELGDKELGNSG